MQSAHETQMRDVDREQEDRLTKEYEKQNRLLQEIQALREKSRLDLANLEETYEAQIEVGGYLANLEETYESVADRGREGSARQSGRIIYESPMIEVEVSLEERPRVAGDQVWTNVYEAQIEVGDGGRGDVQVLVAEIGRVLETDE